MKKQLIMTAVGLMVGALGIVLAATWFSFRVYVPEDACAVLIRKMGDALPAGQLVATVPGQRGIQEEVLGPGRYFYNPLIWDYEIKALTVIPAGDPTSWKLSDARNAIQPDTVRTGSFDLKGEFPKVGVVTRKVGSKAGAEQVIVKRESGMQGILEEVLTPGVYKVNPYVYDVQIHPAVVIPTGFVGVVTNLFGAKSAGLESAAPADEANAGRTRPLVNPGERGTLRDVLQPGVYFINPKLQKVTLVEIGFNEYSQTKLSDAQNFRISFPSDTGYLIRVGVTVVWGIHPQHAAEIINDFGNVDAVLERIIGPQLRSICRNIGSTYAARDFIQGEKRELFQKALTAELQRVARARNIEVLIALVREIEVHAPTAGPNGSEVTEDLKRTIQQSHIAIESQITKEKQREAATVRAQLEEEKKKVEIAREMIRAESRLQVANVSAEGEKRAAEIDAEARLDVATIQQEVAGLNAQRIEIMGRANADVERMKNEAEAKGYEMLVGAFGSGYAYNLYTFAENFKPKSIQMFYAGEGTFWTDLSRFEDLGAAKVLEASDAGARQRKPEGK